MNKEFQKTYRSEIQILSTPVASSESLFQISKIRCGKLATWETIQTVNFATVE